MCSPESYSHRAHCFAHKELCSSTLLVSLQSFCVVLNQHSPMADQAAHFLVTLKRPEQRQLDQQRKVSFCDTQIIQMIINN